MGTRPDRHAAHGSGRLSLARLCRYLSPPPLAYGRLQGLDADRLSLAFKTPWDDGTHVIVVSPRELIEKLAVLFPPSRISPIRFNGVLVPHAADRASCHRFEVNQFRLLLHSVAYMLRHALQEWLLQGTPLQRAYFDTLQQRLLKVAVRVVERATVSHFHWPTSFPLQDLYRLIAHRLQPSPAEP